MRWRPDWVLLWTYLIGVGVGSVAAAIFLAYGVLKCAS